MSRRSRKDSDTESAFGAPSKDERIVDFSNPPVSEVVCIIGFKQPQNYSGLHMGLFWDVVKAEFPLVERQTPLPPPGATAVTYTVPNEIPSPRYFLRSADRTELVQLQDDRFGYNWIKADPETKYPRYSNIIIRFNALKEKFREFMTRQGFGDLELLETRLTYVNHIFKGQGWQTLADLKAVFPDYNFRKRGRRYLRPPTAWHIRSHHPISDHMSRLEITIGSGARRVGEETQPILIAQLDVINDRSPPTVDRIEPWFNMAREAIDLSFLDLTSPKLQQEVWGIDER